MGERIATTQGGYYGVKLVRGPFVRLSAHPQSCADEGAFLSYAARLRAQGAHLAADLFSGGGGLSLGLEAAGYRVVLAADKDTEAVETHRHHFGGLALNWDLGDTGRVTKLGELVSRSEPLDTSSSPNYPVTWPLGSITRASPPTRRRWQPTRSCGRSL